MIYVTGAGNAKANINEDFTVTGDPVLVGVIESYIIQLKPQSTHAISPLAWFYYELLKQGVQVDIDPQDLEDTALPDGATP